MNSVFVAVLVCVLSGKAFTANIDASCANDAACTPSNSHCRMDFTNCDNGECECDDGYTANSGKTACLTNKGLDEACSATTYCLYGSECDTGNTDQCKCPTGETHNTVLNLCVTTGTMAISQQCSQASECYGYSSTSADNKVECVAATGSSTTYCRCLSGYITENNMCRKPHFGEACTTGVGCVVQADLSDTSQTTETCQSDNCDCPSATDDEVSVTFQSTTYTVCMADYTSTLKANSAACTASNQCSSRYCGTCPGASSKTCLRASSGAKKVGAFSLLFVLVTTLLVLVF